MSEYADVRALRRDPVRPDDTGAAKGLSLPCRWPARTVPGPYKVWVHNPKLVHAAEPLGQHFTPGKSSLSEREREIAVVVITSKWRSAYPNNAHEKRGKEVGLPAAAVEAIVAGAADIVRDQREQAVYEVATALAGERAGAAGACTTAR